VSETTFDGRGSDERAALVSVPFLALFGAMGVALAVAGEPLGAVALGATTVGGIGWVVRVLRYRPVRVVVTDAGVVLHAPARVVSIPWADLVSVERRRGRDSRLLWRRRQGRAVSTSDDFANVHRLLVEIERRAPHVVVES
jgi:hypothetical protein